MITKDRVLIIDMLNLFLRNYVVNPTITPNGDPNGGFYGSLRSIQKMIKDTMPETVVCVWDGPGAAKRKRQKHQGYKEGRRPIKKNFSIPGMSQQEENDNRYDQQVKLIDFLNHCPVIQLMINEVEADDIIGYLCGKPLAGKQKVIVSNDQDFLQLLDDETIQYFPVRDKFYNKETVLEQYRIHPKNFVIARAMAGDKSDNIQGLDRVGLKSVANRFEFLAEDNTYYISDVLKYAREIDSNLAIYEKVLKGEQLMKDNYSLMQLYTPSISPQARSRIDYALKDFDYNYNNLEVDKALLSDSISSDSLAKMTNYFKILSKKC